MYRIGLDVGSTTAKIIVLDDNNKVAYSSYRRHQANPGAVIKEILNDLKSIIKESEFSFSVTGSVGLGLAERCGFNFVQEVVGATEYTKKLHPDVCTLIDIGGEDAKIVYLKDGKVDGLRMNGNCAGGTGAFIDQMALCLGVDVTELNGLAENAKGIYPIASRCGVFSKTDIQNLIARNASKEDIAASIFRAVAVQTASALSHGCEVLPKVLLCGGPLTFIPALRKAIADYFKLDLDKDVISPELANYVPAWGTALADAGEKVYTIDSLSAILDSKENQTIRKESIYSVALPPVFKGEDDYQSWLKDKANDDIKFKSIKDIEENSYLGIDSGSTTTKIVLTNSNGEILFRYYAHNGGNPVQAVAKGLGELKKTADEAGVKINIVGGCSTGYGEDLIKAAFSLNYGMIETMAHYVAAKSISPKVSFILDIGGQDMKAIYVNNGVLTRMEINEACSSGCGSFIETFSQTLGCEIGNFVREATKSEHPCDLGTRCTVFMNSKVKQVLREGYSLSDISAGLAYSVVKNCLFKVLKIKNYDELGKHIVLQGGTMRNDAVVKAFENLTGKRVCRNNIPELMGAYGCALYAIEQSRKENCTEARPLDSLMNAAEYEIRPLQCKGCENNCRITQYTFKNGGKYYSGNKCEKIFTNGGNETEKGENMSDMKYHLTFDLPETEGKKGLPTIGIPRALNMYEEYPFWYSIFTNLGFKVILSNTSTYVNYEKGVHSVMSDNICFPAKLIHSHIYELAEKADRIFYPRVVHERTEDNNAQDSFNCPIIIGYPDVIDSAVSVKVPVDSPIVAFKNAKLLREQLLDYFTHTFGIKRNDILDAIDQAEKDWTKWGEDLRRNNVETLQNARKKKKMTILLAGRPYHTDPLVQHRISEMIAKLGVEVITEEIARGGSVVLQSETPEAFHIRQWSFVNRILNAAQWVAEQDNDVHFVEMTSFGCGPDAFLTDEIRSILARHGKSLTLLKIDDVNNIGSLKLRVRSLIDSLKYEYEAKGEIKEREKEPFVKTGIFAKGDKETKTILAPFFTEYMSPLLPSAFKAIGYNLVALPMGNAESNEEGLRYSNNEVCYPATLVVGDFIKALKSGKYDINNTAVTITQLGQCRATNYPALIKRALVDAGFSQVPVISLGIPNEEEYPGFNLPYFTAGPIVLNSLLYGDWISIMYHAIAVREKNKGEAKAMREKYLELAKPLIEAKKSKKLIGLLKQAVEDFNSIDVYDKTYPKAGIAGEIFLKFNPYSHKHISDWLMDHGVEVLPPTFHNFFLKILVNIEFNRKNKIIQDKFFTSQGFMDFVYRVVYHRVKNFEKAASGFRYFEPEPDIRTISKWAEEVLCLSVQSGEGWLLPAETIQYMKQGCNNVVSLQPFGCIANHICARGIEKKMKTLYPQLNMLALDFDGGVSEANIANRLLLFISNMK
ncbi:MAG: acyl-CoA dehydratase activase-related protein [Paludibacteraceae bacterium]|nr:acyl-CoA dehydratase activase-related protein [Paludibacteraceae bacterium]